MDSDVKYISVCTTIGVVLVVATLIGGAIHGCDVEAVTARARNGQKAAVLNTCIANGNTPLECTNALDKM